VFISLNDIKKIIDTLAVGAPLSYHGKMAYKMRMIPLLDLLFSELIRFWALIRSKNKKKVIFLYSDTLTLYNASKHRCETQDYSGHREKHYTYIVVYGFWVDTLSSSWLQ